MIIEMSYIAAVAKCVAHLIPKLAHVLNEEAEKIFLDASSDTEVWAFPFGFECLSEHTRKSKTPCHTTGYTEG